VAVPASDTSVVFRPQGMYFPSGQVTGSVNPNSQKEPASVKLPAQVCLPELYGNLEPPTNMSFKKCINQQSGT